MDLVKVRLRKYKNYVYCYLREDIILDEDCDCYKHNLEVDNQKDPWHKGGRTHHKSSYAGYSYRGVSGTILNSCDYCIKNLEQYEEFLLPEKASKIYRLKHGENKSFLKRLFDKM